MAVEAGFIELATPGVKGLHPYQPGKPTEELERELGLSNIVKLASNENPLGMSVTAKRAIEAQFAELARYPDGNGFRLKAALAHKYAIEPEQITLGNGSNDVLELIVRAFTGPENSVVYSQYAFAVYALATQAVGARAIVPAARDWGHDLEAMAKAIDDRTRIVFIANPNNPTGTVLKATALNAFLDRVPESVLVVLDEAYCEYIDDPSYPDGLSLLAEYRNLIVTRTFSKAWGLASLRVGYALSNTQIADVLNRVRQPFNVNSMALAAAEAVLNDAEYIQRSVDVNDAGLKQLEQGFKSLGLSFIPSHGNFICFDTAQDAQPIYQALLQQGVIVRPVGAYGMPRHLRVSVGLPDENARFLEALEAVL